MVRMTIPKHQSNHASLRERIFYLNPFEAMVDKLAEYEDTGLTPEEIKELINGTPTWLEKYFEYRQAEEQGLLIKLSKEYSTEEVKDIVHTLIQGHYGVPIPKEEIDTMVDDIMR